MTQTSLPLPTRLWLAWLSFFRILFDGQLAAEVARLSAGEPASLPSAEPALDASAATVTAEPRATAEQGALQLLSLFQREGRFVDFVQQEIVKFSDAEIGAAARLVHEGCRRAIRGHARVVSIRNEAEGTPVTLAQASSDVKLVGNVAGSAPFHGVLRHRGWRVEELSLPKLIGEHDLRVIAPAELELS